MAQPTAPIRFPDPKEMKTARVSRWKISSKLYRTLRPQSAEPAAAHLQHLGLVGYANLSKPSPPTFETNPPNGCSQLKTAVHRARRDPLPLSSPGRPSAVGDFGLAPQGGGGGLGSTTPRQAALQRAQRQGDAREGQRKMLNTRAIFTLALSLPKRFLASKNIAFKGKKGPKH